MVSKPTRRTLGGGTNKGQTVTVIEAPTRYNQRRKAIITFWVTLLVTALLGGTVASHYLHPILGILVGIAAGVFVGAFFAALVIIWPIVRIIWWWLPEILLGGFLVYGWTWLMLSTPLWLSLAVVAGVAGGIAVVRAARLAVMSAYWCLAVRHRLRLCFAAFVANNRQGTLPMILFARPTPAGERVWIWLRPGLSLHDLEQPGQLQKLAVGCWANEVRVMPSGRKYAALLRLDVIRREPLGDTVLSNLPDLVPDDMPANAPTSPAVPPLGVNLVDVPVSPRRSPDNKETRPRRARQPEAPSSNGIDPSDYA
ncbi:hypothetical protein B0I29_104272 [Actinoplanes lutulentus]|uniref:Uncharacterized protein n=1 Tax=Actinoplanes lutulentus TaxID=1287878 RepID=A0A327ZFJ5_9ACTN|nr:hypothetical protein B0I29_104272 [Actinoplanes lutulentus]